MEQARIERSVVIDAPPAHAWSRIVDGFSDWFGDDASLTAHLGGRVTSGGREGRVTRFDEESSLRWEWSRDGDPGWTEVEITIRPVGAGTEISVVEVLHAWEQVTYGAQRTSDAGAESPLALAAR